MESGVAVFVWLSIGSIALFTFLGVAAWTGTRARERELYYKNDLLKKIAESPEAGGAAAMQYLREQHRLSQERRRGGLAARWPGHRCGRSGTDDFSVGDGASPRVLRRADSTADWCCSVLLRTLYVVRRTLGRKRLGHRADASLLTASRPHRNDWVPVLRPLQGYG